MAAGGRRNARGSLAAARMAYTEASAPMSSSQPRVGKRKKAAAGAWLVPSWASARLASASAHRLRTSQRSCSLPMATRKSGKTR
jgi:hypothetical protein